MLTYKDLYTQALTYLDSVNDTGQMLSMVKYAIQMAHETRLTKQRWSFMMWGNYQTVNFLNGVRNYTLHPLAQMVDDFKHIQTGDPMRETPSRSRWDYLVQNDKAHFEFVQDSPIILPFTSGVLTVTGTAVIVRYVDTNGNLVEETLTNAPTSQSVDTMLNVSKTITTTTVVITDSAAKTLLSLSASEYGKTYPQIKMFSDGVTGESAQYRFYRRPKKLTNDFDIPEIPYPFSRILVFDAVLDIAAYQDSRPNPYWVEKQRELGQSLEQAYQEGEMSGSEPRHVRETDSYEG